MIGDVYAGGNLKLYCKYNHRLKPLSIQSISSCNRIQKRTWKVMFYDRKKPFLISSVGKCLYSVNGIYEERDCDQKYLDEYNGLLKVRVHMVEVNEKQQLEKRGFDCKERAFKYLIGAPIYVYNAPVFGLQIKHREFPCKIKCIWGNVLGHADGGVYHVPEVNGIFPSSFVPKFTIGYSLEAPGYHPKVKKIKAFYDAEMSYRTDADIWTPYVTTVLDQTIEKWTAEKKKYTTSQIDGATFIQNNCQSLSGREGLVTDLQQYFRVDSLGKCLNNKHWGSNDKLATIGKYKFHLAWENQYSQDYVTEKVYHALLAGTIPVYLGSANVAKFVPENSFIDIRKFSNNMSRLAGYLHYLISNSSALSKFHKWRADENLGPIGSVFQKTADNVNSRQCRSCMYIYSQKYGIPWNKSMQVIDSGRQPRQYACIGRSNLRYLSLQEYLQIFV